MSKNQFAHNFCGEISNIFNVSKEREELSVALLRNSPVAEVAFSFKTRLSFQNNNVRTTVWRTVSTIFVVSDQRSLRRSLCGPGFWPLRSDFCFEISIWLCCGHAIPPQMALPPPSDARRPFPDHCIPGSGLISVTHRLG